MNYVYILISENDPKCYYIGITENVNARLKEHNQKKVNYSKQYAPRTVETVIEFKTKKLAYVFEFYLKSGSGHAFLKKHFLP